MGGQSSALTYPSRKPHANISNRGGSRVDRAQTECSVVLAHESKQRVVGAPDRGEHVRHRPKAVRLARLQARRLQVDQKQPGRRRRCAEGAEQVEQSASLEVSAGTGATNARPPADWLRPLGAQAIAAVVGAR